MKLIQFKGLIFRIKTFVLSVWPLSAIRKNIWTSAGAENRVNNILQRPAVCFDGFSVADIEDPRAVSRLHAENQKWNIQEDVICRVDNQVYLEPVKFFVPSPINLWKVNVQRRTSKIPKAFLFDGYASRNLYHFFQDALNPLMMMLDSGQLQNDIPVIYNHKIHHLKWFEYFRTQEPFSQINWRIQNPAEWIECNDLYKGYATYKWWNRLYENVGSRLNKIPSRNIFIERKMIHARSFSNKDEIHHLLKAYDFEVLVLDDLSYPEQIAIFASAKNIAGHHGAGLSNIIYSEAPKARLLELFSSDYIMPHYAWLAKTIGFEKYSAGVGSHFDIHKNYRMDPVVLKRHLELLVR
jgi:Glycosyltransferase 61